ncbi:MAG TPA: Type 1 glutamine amidotransferase-like domain-containing protein [Herpetosiphonaceae bacterium]
MKLLLTSGGVTNTRIHSALVDLLGTPMAESQARCIPTAPWGHPLYGPASVRGVVVGAPPHYMSGLGWTSVGVLERTARPSIGMERWVPWVVAADVLLVDGGDATYRCHGMRQSGLADLLPSLPATVWVGVRVASMVLPPRIGASFVAWPSAPDDRTLGVVDGSIFPHLDAFPTNTLADAARWAADLSVPAYAIDEPTAITVVDGSVEVVSEGNGKRVGGRTPTPAFQPPMRVGCCTHAPGRSAMRQLPPHGQRHG